MRERKRSTVTKQPDGTYLTDDGRVVTPFTPEQYAAYCADQRTRGGWTGACGNPNCLSCPVCNTQCGSVRAGSTVFVFDPATVETDRKYCRLAPQHDGPHRDGDVEWQDRLPEPEGTR